MDFAQAITYALYGLMGIVCAQLGFTMGTWQFWFFLVMLLSVDFVSAHRAWDRGWEAAKAHFSDEEE